MWASAEDHLFRLPNVPSCPDTGAWASKFHTRYLHEVVFSLKITMIGLVFHIRTLPSYLFFLCFMHPSFGCQLVTLPLHFPI